MKKFLIVLLAFGMPSLACRAADEPVSGDRINRLVVRLLPVVPANCIQIKGLSGSMLISKDNLDRDLMANLQDETKRGNYHSYTFKAKLAQAYKTAVVDQGCRVLPVENQAAGAFVFLEYARRGTAAVRLESGELAESVVLLSKGYSMGSGIRTETRWTTSVRVGDSGALIWVQHD